MIQFILNETTVSTALPTGTLLLDFIRYHKNLSGTKIGCREGDCGACTVLVGELKGGELIYRSVTSCLMPIGNAHGKHIVTVEGVNVSGLNFIQQSFAEEGATQCGFCTPGFIVSLAGYCLNENNIGPVSAVDAVNGNICRCTGYKSIERAACKIESKLAERKTDSAIDFAISNNILPAYFSTIKIQLEALSLQKNGFDKANDINTKFLGGGTDLYVQQHDTMVHTDINFLFNKISLKGITKEDNRCTIGASVTVTDIFESTIFKEHFPNVYQYIRLISSTQIRNMATVAGNLVNASPIGDLTIIFLALDAQLVLSDGNSSREVPLRKFYKGYKLLDKKSEEFIQSMYFELPGNTDKFHFEKVCKRTHLDIASVNTAISISIKDNIVTTAGISAGGVGPVPTFLSNASNFLQGKLINEETIDQLVEVIQSDISPISDARGTATYKRFLLSQLIRAHFATLFPIGDANLMNA